MQRRSPAGVENLAGFERSAPRHVPQSLLSRSPAVPRLVPYPQKRPQTFCGGGAAMERRPPAGYARRERSAMRRDDATTKTTN